MSKFPFYKQYDTMDCGATCLQMITEFYGKSFTLDKIRDLCFVSREGVSMLGISDAAENLGFKTIGGSLTYEQLHKKALLPCILHWNQNHFVIVYKIKKNKIYIADPASDLLVYSKKEFLKNWISTVNNKEEKGIALLLEPTVKFYEQEEVKYRNSLSFLFSYFNKYRRFFNQLLIGLLLGSLIQLIFPFLTQSVVDIGIANQNLGFIYLVLLAQMVLFISRMSVDFIRRWLLLHISTRINISLISDFFIKLMKLPMYFFDTKLIGDIIQRIEDHERLERFLTVQTLNIVFSFFTFIIFGVVLLVYSIKIFLIFIFGSILYTLWIFAFLSKRKKLDYKHFDQSSKNQSKIYQLITGMHEIKLQNCEKRKRWEWEDVQVDLFKINVLSLSLEQFQEAGNIFINETKNIFISIVAATAVINGSMTLGMMLAVQYIIGQLNSPLEQAVRFIHDFQDARISLERINEIHQKNDENKDCTDIINNKLPEKKDICINNLVFQYEGPHSTKVLNEINLVIPEGKITAIVGSSGSGKTTLIKLLLQYYNPIEGQIKIGNIDLNSLNTTFWKNKCGVVMQDGFIFSESIARNIAVSDEEINKERLLYATKMANIHKSINALPLKYNTIIGQEGKNLSHGQKQRILIARAIYKNPEFIFLDEATNSLDAINEKKIISNLEKFFVGKTVIIVAHRLSTVKNADQIVVLENGIIIEVGDHKKLTSKKGAYYELVKNQLELGN